MVTQFIQMESKALEAVSKFDGRKKDDEVLSLEEILAEGMSSAKLEKTNDDQAKQRQPIQNSLQRLSKYQVRI